MQFMSRRISFWQILMYWNPWSIPKHRLIGQTAPLHAVPGNWGKGHFNVLWKNDAGRRLMRLLTRNAKPLVTSRQISAYENHSFLDPCPRKLEYDVNTMRRITQVKQGVPWLPGDVVKYECLEKMLVTQGSLVVECQADYTWNDTLAQCKSRSHLLNPGLYGGSACVTPSKYGLKLRLQKPPGIRHAILFAWEYGPILVICTIYNEINEEKHKLVHTINRSLDRESNPRPLGIWQHRQH
jgi:hypothetical protein